MSTLARKRPARWWTGFTARDLMQIVDAVEDDGLLRYWGFSYGTTLGATVSAMFPDRVDKVILDGVQNPHEYFNAYDVEMFADSDFAFPQGMHKKQLTPVFRTSDQISRLFGTVTNGLDMICSQWKFEAKERYTGEFKAKTRHPLLFIGNSYDSATPTRSAYNVSSGFEGSVVLENGGFGHGSISHGSVCTGKAIRNYFKDGTIPASGTVCEVDYPPFANKTWADVLPKLDL